MSDAKIPAQGDRELGDYDFDNDREFQAGLSEILSSMKDAAPEERERLVASAKAFYISRMDLSPRNEIQADTSNTGDAIEPRPLTFGELTELIRSGQTHLIPNNREIPEEISSETPSKSSLRDIPKKPWEK